MDSPYVAATFGLIGALVGSMTSVATIWIQAKVKDRRDRMQQVTMMAMEHFKSNVDFAHKTNSTKAVLPPSVFAAYYLRFMELMEKGQLNPETFAKLSEESDVLAQLAVGQGFKPK